MNKKNLCLLVLCCLLLCSCDYFSEVSVWNKKNVIASVGNKKLMRSDLVNLVKPATSKKDSIVIVENYVNNWVKKQLIIQEAEKEFSTSDLNREIENFREMLLLSKYENMKIQQGIDTLITDNEVEKYYRDNKKYFLLSEPMVKLAFVPITYIEASAKKKLESAFKEKGGEKKWIEEVEKTLVMIDYKVPFVVGNWVHISKANETYYTAEDDFAKQVKIVGNVFDMHSDEGVYLVKVMDKLEENTPAPISYMKQQIKSIILNKRKSDFVKNFENDLFSRALWNKQVKINIDKSYLELDSLNAIKDSLKSKKS